MELYSEPFSIVEALLALRSKGLRSHQEEVFALLDRWRRRDELKEVPSSPKSCLPSFDEPYSLPETINLIYLYRQLSFFLDDYSTNMRRPYWIYSPEDWQRCLQIKMSNTKKGRFIRALCRLYTFAHIIVPAYNEPFTMLSGLEEADPWRTESEFDCDGAYLIWIALYGAIPYWEQHEMLCVGVYIQRRHDQKRTARRRKGRSTLSTSIPTKNGDRKLPNLSR